MDRRGFLATGILVLGAPGPARAQPAGRVYRVALVFGTPPVSSMAGAEPASPAVRAFLTGLRTLGYVEGRNLVVERRSAEGRLERLGEILRRPARV